MSIPALQRENLSDFGFLLDCKQAFDNTSFTERDIPHLFFHVDNKRFFFDRYVPASCTHYNAVREVFSRLNTLSDDAFDHALASLAKKEACSVFFLSKDLLKITKIFCSLFEKVESKSIPACLFQLETPSQLCRALFFRIRKYTPSDPRMFSLNSRRFLSVLQSTPPNCLLKDHPDLCEILLQLYTSNTRYRREVFTLLQTLAPYVQSLDLSSITYLSGEIFSMICELFSELCYLNLSHTDIQDADLHHLRQLSKLNTLLLCQTKITSLESLNLLSLRHLDLSFCQELQGSAFDALCHCTNLLSLNLSSTWIHTLRSLTSLKLEKLELCRCQVLDDEGFAPIGEMRSLRILIMQVCNRISSLNPLSLLQNLRVLDISKCFSLFNRGVQAVGGLINLQKLSMQGVRVTHLDAFKGLGRLNFLDISYCLDIQEFSALAFLRSLQELYMENTHIHSLSFLPFLRKLCVLNISNCRHINDKGHFHLRNMPNLKRIADTGSSLVPVKEEIPQVADSDEDLENHSVDHKVEREA